MFRVKRTPTVAVGVVRVMKRTANQTSVIARTLAVATRKTIASLRNPRTRRISRKTVFRVWRSPIVAVGVVEVTKVTVNPLSIIARTLAAEKGKTRTLPKSSRARMTHEVRASTFYTRGSCLTDTGLRHTR